MTSTHLTSRLRAGVSGHLGDGLAMSVAAAGAALVGMVSWVLAARALTPAELGTATAFVSAFLLVAGCTEFNIGVGLLRWLPRAGSAAGTLLGRAALVILAVPAVVSACYLLLPDTAIIIDAVVGPAAAPGQRLTGAAVFVLATVLFAFFQQQDYVLVGLGRAWWAPLRTLVFAVGRLGVLIVAGAALTPWLVVVSWIAPITVCLLLVGVQAAVLVRRRRTAPPWLPARRAAVTFLAGAYVGQVATSLLFNQVPLLITVRFGPAQGGEFFLLWQAVTVVDVVCLYFVSALSAGVAREPARAAELSTATLRRLLGLVLPLLALGILLAHPILSLFGEVYATHANVLRILLLGLGLRLFVVHRLGEHQASGHGARFGWLAVTNTVLVIGAAVAVPAHAADPLLTFAVEFIAVQIVCAVAVMVRRRHDRRQTGATTP